MSRGWIRRTSIRLAAGVVVATGALAWAPTEAGAVTYVVTTTSDTIAPGETSLREAFLASSLNGTDDTIVLAADATYALTLCAEGPLLSDGNEGLTIEGNGATISQTCSDVGIIQMDGFTSVLTVQDATLDGGPNTGTSISGAAIYSEGNIVLNGVTVTGVDGGPSGSVVEAQFSGGPVPYTIQVIDSTITNNDNTAIITEFASLLVQNSTISNNNGGGVSLVDGSPVVITDSTITDNVGRGARTTGQGSSTMTITNSTITNNGRGGAECSACETFTITDSVITDNGATATAGNGSGVAMAIDQDSVDDIPRLTITNSDVSRNRSMRKGGGVNVSIIETSEPLAPETIVSISNSTIDDNWTEGDNVPGGGINLELGSLQISGTSVSGNEAGRFGTLTDSPGGGIRMTRNPLDEVSGYDVQFGGVTVDGNTARGAGGGLHLSLDGHYEIDQLSLANNVAMGDGGGAIINGSGSLFQSNIAGNDGAEGGGLWLDRFGAADSVYVGSTTISGNDATVRGGGAYLHKADVTFENVTVTGNAAPRGGGIHVGEDPMGQSGSHTIDHVTLAGNSAPVGSNLSFDVGDLSVSRSIVAEPLGGGSNCDLGGYEPSSGGWTYFTDATCAAGSDDTVSAVSPSLGALGNNGGPTPTRLLGTASAAGGLVPVADCGAPFDQRGIARPAGTACDPGATEIVETAVSGSNGDETMTGNNQANVLRGLGGADTLRGLGGKDVLDGGEGDDRLIGGYGNDTLIGGPGVDELRGGPGTDTLIGGPGIDRCYQNVDSAPVDC